MANFGNYGSGKFDKILVKDITVSDDITVTDDVAIGGALTVTGASTLTGAVTGNVIGDVTGNVTGNITSAFATTGNVGVTSVLTAAITWETADGALFTVPAAQIWLVHAMLLQVTTDYDAGGTNDAAIIIGTDGDTDGFLVLADGDLQAADTELTGAPAGWQGLSAGVQGAFLDGNWAAFPVVGADTIDIATAGTGADAGAATVYMIYTRVA